MLLFFARMKCFLLFAYFGINKSSGQETTNLACNGSVLDVSGTFGTISSPNYPDLYPNQARCRWAITTPAGTRIAVKFAKIFAIEQYFILCLDSLIFEEEGSTLEICGSVTYESFLSAGNALNVSFFTDISITQAGFSFNWSAVGDVPAPVSVNISTTSGVISSPNYPNPYPPLSDYVWNIQNGTPGKYKLLKFQSLFDVEGFSDGVCPYDSLTIEDFDQTFTLRYCDRVHRLLQLTRSSDIRVKFKSDHSIEGAGFSFSFSEIDPPTCEAEAAQTGSSGVVSTPSFPLAYDTGLDCTWFITAPENTVIAVRFNPLFQIEETTGCGWSFLQIFDGPSTNSLQFQHDFCGQHSPRNFLTTNNSLTARFVSSAFSTGSYVGFSLNWTAEAQCEAGKFSCWDGSCIAETLTCNGVVDCPMDIADEATCSQENSTACGIQQITPVFYWNARIIGGHEVRKGSWPWQGYIQVNSQGNWFFLCGATLIFEDWAMTAAHCIVDKGLPTRVVFGDHSLGEEDPEIEQISFVDDIFVPSGYRFGFENPWRYGSDIALLHLSNSVNPTAYVKPVCLPTSPPVAGETLVITGWGKTSVQSRFLADILRQVRSPVVSREECNKGQGFEVPDSVFCIGAESGGANSCEGDSGGPAVRLTNGTWQLSGIASFGIQCGVDGDNPSAYADIYNLLPQINSVITDYTPVKPNFTTVVINKNTSGVITSPNYGSSNYPQNSALRWFITAPENMVIAVRFNSNFSIEPRRYGQSPCGGDFLWIYDGSSTNATKYGTKKLCGTFPPPDFESNSNKIIVEFQSDLSFESTGFKITWTAVDACENDQFRCWNTTCIPLTEKCDGFSDCVNEEDEIQCARGEPKSTECGKAVVAPDIPWNPLIVGGHASPEGAWPWQVALYAKSDEDWFFVCGGILIEEDMVLTAAHCIGPNRYQVSVGDYDLSTTTLHERRIDVLHQIVHPYYAIANDIAVLILSDPVDFTSQWTKPVCLPSRNDSDPIAGTTCMITGWGLTGIYDTLTPPNILQQAHVFILDNAECDAIFAGGVEFLQKNFICAGHEHERTDACFGDSGGGLFCLKKGSWVQYGIVSFGTICGLRTYYERISLHHDFLENVRNLQKCSGLEIREGTSGTIMPPTVLGEYLPDTNCSWLLRGPRDTVLEIQFDFFSLESCNYFFYDFLNVYDGNSTSARQFLDEPICGTIGKVRGFESTSNEVLITFVSDSSVESSGFRITWMAVENCGPEYFRCWNGSCIDINLKCDGSMDCLDKSDEAECPKVGSEECGRQDIEPEFMWPARIVGGSFVKNGSWPSQVYLRIGGTYSCAGTILNSHWILTLAKCIEFALGPIFVVVGEIDAARQPDDSKMYIVKETFIPPEYKVEDGFDIGLLQLKKSIEFSSFVQPACLALPNETYAPEAGETCVLLGWGRTSEDGSLSSILRQTRVPVMDPDICKKVLDTFDREKMFCGANIGNGGVGACSSDDGGPVMCLRDSSWIQFGIITRKHGCGVPDSADLYTKVSYYTRWIEQTINGSLPSPPKTVTQSTSSTIQVHETTQAAGEETTTDSLHQTMSETTGDEGSIQKTTTEPLSGAASTTGDGFRLRPNTFMIVLFLILLF